MLNDTAVLASEQVPTFLHNVHRFMASHRAQTLTALPLLSHDLWVDEIARDSP